MSELGPPRRRFVRRLAARWVRLACALVAMAASAPSRAQAPAAPASRLVAHLAAPAATVAALGERLRPRLEALGVALELDLAGADIARALEGPPATEGGAAALEGAPALLGEAWLDGRSTRAATLAIVPRGARRALVRRVSLSAGYDEVALAEIVYVVERSVAALLAAEPIGVPADEARALLEPAPPPPAAPERARLAASLGAFLGTEAWSSDHVVGPTVGAAVLLERARAAVRVGAGLEGAWRLGFHEDTAAGRLAIGGGSAYALLALGHAADDGGPDRLVVRLLLGPGLVVDEVEATPASAAAVSTRPRTDFALSGRAALRLDFALGARARAFVTAGVAVTRGGRYTIIQADGSAGGLAVAWPVRPGLALGFAFETARRARSRAAETLSGE